MQTHLRTDLPERNLDVLRAVAVLAVLGCHVGILTHVGAGAWWLALGRAGVLCFFVHTACVLMASLERGGTAPGWVMRFYVRRLFRLYPLALVLVAGVVLVRMPNQLPQIGSDIPYHPLGVGALLANAALVQNVVGAPNASPVLWSLPLEVQMYLVLPLLYVLLRRRTLSLIARALLLMGVAVVMGLVAQTWGGDGTGQGGALAMFAFAPVFSVGVLLDLFTTTGTGASRRLPAEWLLPLLLVLLLAFSTTYVVPTPIPERGWLLGLGVGLLLLTCRELPASRLTAWAKQVATYSYGVYLFHVPALWAVVALKHAPPVVRWSAALGLLVALPIAGYHWIEAPGIQLGKRLTETRLTAPRHSPARARVSAVDTSAVTDAATAPAP